MKAMTLFAFTAAHFLLLAQAESATGAGWERRYGGYSYPVSSSPCPPLSYPAWRPVVVEEERRRPVSAPRYASPRPAPPSPEPILRPPAIHPDSRPRVIESHYRADASARPDTAPYYDTYNVAMRGNESASTGGRCSVFFWNATDRPVELVVEGQGYVIPSGRERAFSLPRTFRWQLAGRPVETTELNVEQRALEIVIRR